MCFHLWLTSKSRSSLMRIEWTNSKTWSKSKPKSRSWGKRDRKRGSEMIKLRRQRCRGSLMRHYPLQVWFRILRWQWNWLISKTWPRRACQSLTLRIWESWDRMLLISRSSRRHRRPPSKSKSSKTTPPSSKNKSKSWTGKMCLGKGQLPRILKWNRKWWDKNKRDTMQLIPSHHLPKLCR